MIRWHTETRKSVTSKNYFFSFFLDETQGLSQKFSLQAAETAAAQVADARIKRLAEKRSVQFSEATKIQDHDCNTQEGVRCFIMQALVVQPPNQIGHYCAYPLGLVVWDDYVQPCWREGQSINEVSKGNVLPTTNPFDYKPDVFMDPGPTETAPSSSSQAFDPLQKISVESQAAGNLTANDYVSNFNNDGAKTCGVHGDMQHRQKQVSNSDLYQTIYPTVVNPMQKSSEADSRTAENSLHLVKEGATRWHRATRN